MELEELTKKIKVISQEAWTVETNTTVNAICEYIIREAIYRIVIPDLEALKELNIKYNNLVLLMNDLADDLEELKNASKDGGISEPERSAEASTKSTRKSPKAGRSANGANVGA